MSCFGPLEDKTKFKNLAYIESAKKCPKINIFENFFLDLKTRPKDITFDTHIAGVVKSWY